MPLKAKVYSSMIHVLIRSTLLLILIVLFAPAWAQSDSLPRVVTFVAPTYPALARDSHIAGTTTTRMKVGKDGRVIEAKFVSSNAIFAKSVLAALKQWTFPPSQQEYVFEVVCRFEFDSSAKGCDEEAFVSAKLPTNVLIRTTSKCIGINTPNSGQNR